MSFRERISDFLAFVRALIEARRTGGAVLAPGLSRRDLLRFIGAGAAVAALPDLQQNPPSVFETTGSFDAGEMFSMADIEDAMKALERASVRPAQPIVVLSPAQAKWLQDQRPGEAPENFFGVRVLTSEYMPSSVVLSSKVFDVR